MAQPVRVQHVRRRKFERIRHLSSNLLRFMSTQATRLGATQSNHACTVDESVGEFSSTSGAHGFITGKTGPIMFRDTDDADLPIGLDGDIRYWPIVQSDTVFLVALSREDAANGIAITSFGDEGNVGLAYYFASATHDVHRWLSKGTKARTIRGVTDIDTTPP